MAPEAEDELQHYGTPRHSGRYPWGSGDDAYQNNASFLGYVADLRKQGLSDAEIYTGLGMNSSEFRARKTIAKDAKKTADRATAIKLKEKGWSNIAIGENLGMGESSVRDLLKPSQEIKEKSLQGIASTLKEHVDSKGYLDIGAGTENQLGVSDTKLKVAAAILKDQGYVQETIHVKQVGTNNQYTELKVLAPPGTTRAELLANRGKITTIDGYSEDGGTSLRDIKPPTQVDPKRVSVKYAEDGGALMDGVIEVRRGVPDVSLGDSTYAQVRIAVGGDRFLKGMAMYSDDLPPGVDLRFNTNKSDTGNKLDAMKPIKGEEDNPFGATVRQRDYIDADGKPRLSPMNIVNEEGDWSKWSKSVSSQMLSKQSVPLAKKLLDTAYGNKKADYDEIKSLTNPTVKKRLLEAFSDEADSAAVHLKAAALPRQRSSVILPINDLKDSEIYAPKFRDGERVVLIRYPHGGVFEIPELTVNNKNQSGKRILGDALDAVGINAKVAERLSGADFDGDTVLVIPDSGRIKTAPALAGLKNFDPKIYKLPDDAPKMTARQKGMEMGKVSNLITDMTIKGAPFSEIARAVRHSMVVIDAEKHHLDYKQSYVDNNIASLNQRYQNKAIGGASTIISRASSDVRVTERKLQGYAKGGPFDPVTGKKVYVETGAGYTKVGKNGKETWVPRTTTFKKMELADDARSLLSDNPVPMELAYATHANKLKALANEARKEMYSTPNLKYSPPAKKQYESEVKSLKASINVARKNKPLERQAQLLANVIMDAKMKEDPDMDSADIKRLKGRALDDARRRIGSDKASTQIKISDNEWRAIQAGAISNNMLEEVLSMTDLDRVRELAMPRTIEALPAQRKTQALTLLSRGYTQQEVADSIGVSISTLQRAIE